MPDSAPAPKKPTTPKPRAPTISQADFPAYSIEDATKVARAILDNYAGALEAPHNIAIAMDLNPTGSQWRMMTSAAFAFGIITGTYSAERIGLTTIGRTIVAPTSEGADLVAIKQATLTPKVLSTFFKKFDRSKLPKDIIINNILFELGIPKERLDQYRLLLLNNGRYAGFIRDTPTGGFVALEGVRTPTASHHTASSDTATDNPIDDDIPEALRHIVAKPDGGERGDPSPPTWDLPVSSVFISHGKNQRILEQVREIVAFGKFVPVVSKDRETVSKPVPDKVMDDMRNCQAAVIHVASEGALVDENGTPVHRINENVLIEIGAAMALYRRRFILLVEDGLTLPSNLQGLYEVRYKGGALDGDSTMKLLKAFNDFSTPQG